MSAEHSLSAWRERGRILDVFGRRVFVVDEPAAEPEKGSPLLVLHGFPTSSHDFVHALPVLAKHRRVVLLDFLGFGLSDKHEHDSFSLIEQAEVAIDVWRQLGITSGNLLAHDYGTSVATELLARRERRLLPIEIESVTLCNGSMHIELADISVTQKALLHPTAGPLVARLSGRRFFGARMRNLFGRRDSVAEETIDAMWEAIRAEDGHLCLPRISQYLHERRKFWHRWIGALERLDLPVYVVWGKKDPIAVSAIAEQLEREIADVRVTWLPELGHYPMLEDPQGWGRAVIQSLDDKTPPRHR